jgi:hypothetical protein
MQSVVFEVMIELLAKHTDPPVDLSRYVIKRLGEVKEIV